MNLYHWLLNSPNGKIDADTPKYYTEQEIICHCLFEMTFIDFDQDEIQSKLKSIEDEVAEIKNMTEDEKKQKFISLDDIINKDKNKL